MSKIRIKNFGPIKEGFIENDGWLDVKKVTVFIGNQCSGKSTVAKVLSTSSWLEKSLNRDDIVGISSFDFQNFFEYQGVRNYFLPDTEIEYYGERYHIKYNGQQNPPVITPNNTGRYIVPKIMYIPAERNFLSTIRKVLKVKDLPDHLFTFAEELRKAQNELNNKSLNLPLNNYKYTYNEFEDSSYVAGPGHNINLLEASSGLQSLVPLYLVSRNLSLLVTKDDEVLRKNMNADLSIRMNDEITSLMLNKIISLMDKSVKLQEIRSKYLSKCFINIVEEPEQNLYPTSQWQMLKSLLQFNNMSEGNKLIMTTHSPYIINYLSVAIQAGFLRNKIHDKDKNPLNKLSKIVPLEALANSSDVAIYQFKDDGTICRLPDYEGIPSDENFLNQSLAEGNQLFDALLEIEEEL